MFTGEMNDVDGKAGKFESKIRFNFMLIPSEEFNFETDMLIKTERTTGCS